MAIYSDLKIVDDGKTWPAFVRMMRIVYTNASRSAAVRDATKVILRNYEYDFAAVQTQMQSYDRSALADFYAPSRKYDCGD